MTALQHKTTNSMGNSLAHGYAKRCLRETLEKLDFSAIQAKKTRLSTLRAFVRTFEQHYKQQIIFNRVVEQKKDSFAHFLLYEQHEDWIEVSDVVFEARRLRSGSFDVCRLPRHGLARLFQTVGSNDPAVAFRALLPAIQALSDFKSDILDEKVVPEDDHVYIADPDIGILIARYVPDGTCVGGFYLLIKTIIDKAALDNVYQGKYDEAVAEESTIMWERPRVN